MFDFLFMGCPSGIGGGVGIGGGGVAGGGVGGWLWQ